MTLIKINPRSTIESMKSTNKNLLLNGDFSVCQRTEHKPATVQTGVISGSNGVRIDRWSVGGANTTSGIDCSVLYHETGLSSGFATTGFRNAQLIDVTTGNATLDAGNYAFTQQRIETKNVANRLYYGRPIAKSITLSFWVRTTVTGKYGVSLINRKDAASSYRRRNIMSYTVNVSNAWEKKSVTFVGDTDSNFGFDLTNSTQQPYFAVAWHWAAGTNRVASASSDYTSEGVWYTDTLLNGIEFVAPDGQVNGFSSASNNIYLTGCQLEIGTVATDFEHRTFQSQIEDCHRYLFVSNHGNTKTDSQGGQYYTNMYTTAAGQVMHQFPTVMCRIPTVTYTAAGGGVVDGNRTRTDGLYLYDSTDASWRIYNWRADAELGS